MTSSTSLYTTVPQGTVSSNNFTTLYNKPVEINTGKSYGNSNVANFLYQGTDGANTITGITDEGFLTVLGESNLGNISNVHIDGGSPGYVITTDGTGNLTFLDPGSLGLEDIPYIHFDVATDGNNQQFSTGNISLFESNVYINLFKNGVNLEPTTFEKIDDTTVQVNVELATGDTIDILATAAGGSSVPAAGSNTQIQFNDNTQFAGSANLTFDSDTDTFRTINIEIIGVANLSDISNVHIDGGTSGQLLSTDGLGNLAWTTFAVTDANYANYAGTAFSVTGSNVVGPVNSATYSTVATSANSVAGANVSGYVTNATHATIADTANVVAGANVTGYVPNATHATVSNSANAVAGANVTGIVGNATHANVADLANSVSVSNVAGIGNIAVINLNGSTANVLLGDGSWGALGSVANANYSNYAGNVVNASQSNITSLGTLSSLTVGGMTTIQEAKEKFTPNATGATGTVNFDVLTSAITLQTANASANFTLNIRGNSSTTFNSITSNNESTSITYVNKNGATGYYANVIQIDGTPITPVWANSAEPTGGTSNSYDVYNFNILKTGTSTYVVFGSKGDYS